MAVMEVACFCGGIRFVSVSLSGFTENIFWLSIKVYMLLHTVISGNCLFVFIVVLSIRFCLLMLTKLLFIHLFRRLRNVSCVAIIYVDSFHLYIVFFFIHLTRWYLLLCLRLGIQIHVSLHVVIHNSLYDHFQHLAY